MGFFSKLKNAVTGGGVELQLKVGSAGDEDEAVTGEGFAVTVLAQAEIALKFSKVYLLVESYETAVVHDVAVAENNGTRVVVQTVEGETQTANMEIEVAGKGELTAGEKIEWTVEVHLPEGAMPSFQGETIGNHWRIKAGLDAFGNDPDTGWVELEVVL